MRDLPRVIPADVIATREATDAECRRRGLPTRAEWDRAQIDAAEAVVRGVRRWCYGRHGNPEGAPIRCACGHPASEVDPVCAGLAAVDAAPHVLDAGLAAHELYRRATGRMWEPARGDE